MSSYDSIISDIEATTGQLTIEDVYRLIDERIGEAEAAIHRLKCFRNRLAPVCKIPTELLSIILCKAINDIIGQPCVDEADREFHPASWKDHVQLTMNCKRWRDVALGCPLFWQSIPFCSSARYPDMLGRSKGCPLALRLKSEDHEFSIYDEDPMSLPTTITSQLIDPRLGEIHLKLKPRQLKILIAKFPSSGLHSVTHINISNDSAYYGDMGTIPSHIFAASSMPSVRHLVLTGCHIPWGELPGAGALATNLITLRIIHPSFSMPSSVFYNIISSNPRLKDFVLTGKSLSELSRKPCNPIPLTALETHIICVEAPLFEQFYASIIWPKAKPTRLTLTSTDSLSPAHFGELFRNSRLADMCTHVRIHGNFRHLAICSPQVEITFDLGGDGLHSQLIHIIPLLHFPALESLSILTAYIHGVGEPDDYRPDHIEVIFIPSTDVWANFFQRHHTIGTLTLATTGYTINAVLEALGSQDGDLPLLPSLLHLELALPHFCADQPTQIRDPKTSILGDDPYSSFCHFYDSLLSRYGAGHYLEKLKIDTENFVQGEKVIRLVEEVVGVECVEWNHEREDGGSGISL